MNESSKVATLGATAPVDVDSQSCPTQTTLGARHSHAHPMPAIGEGIAGGAKTMIAPMLTELMQRYPSMFEAEHVGLDMVGGWYPVFAQLCADIDALVGPDGHGFGWLQLKEKYGMPRWYWCIRNTSDLSLAAQPERTWETIGDSIRNMVHAAESECESHCMACGNPASLQRLKGRYTTCCAEHLDLLTLQPDAFWRLAKQTPQ